MKKDFDYQALPVHFAHCLNSQCLRADKCLRRQVTSLIPKERRAFSVINPDHFAANGEDCTFFIDEKPELFARGMTHLLDRVPLSDALFINKQIQIYLGRNSYYRCKNKVRLIKPKEQAYIQKLFRQKGITEPPVFDEYVEYYDLSE